MSHKLFEYWSGHTCEPNDYNKLVDQANQQVDAQHKQLVRQAEEANKWCKEYITIRDTVLPLLVFLAMKLKDEESKAKILEITEIINRGIK